MNTTHPLVGTRRVTETTRRTGDLTIQAVGDQDADGRVAFASVCVGGEFLLTAAEARGDSPSSARRSRRARYAVGPYCHSRGMKRFITVLAALWASLSLAEAHADPTPEPSPPYVIQSPPGPAPQGGRLWAQPAAVAIATADTTGSKNDLAGCGSVGVFSVSAM